MGISRYGGGSWLILLLIYIFSDVTSGLQTCSSGTETSSTQIMLDVSSTEINTGGGMCSCRLTVSQTTQVDMFPVRWSPQCDAYMIIQMWRASSMCTNGVPPTLSAQINTVNNTEAIWILVVATKPGVKAGQLQFKVKQPSSAQVNIECFEPNTNSSTTTTRSTRSTSTPNVVTTTSPTRRITSTSQPTTYTETLRSPDTTPQGQPSPRSTGGIEATGASTTQDIRTGCHTSFDDFPGGIFAAGVATGVVLVLTAGGLYVVISRRQWSTSRSQKPDDIPISEAHPTYSGLKSRTEEPINTYDRIGQKPSKGTDNPYINVS